jgi:1-deoxy-D-xylulose-5-phosphate synthase
MSPKDEDELADMLYTALQCSGPVAIRYPRGVGPGTPVKDVPKAIPIGKAELLQHGENDRVGIFALGAMVPMALEIASKLEGEGVSSAVINARFAKPIDAEMVEFYARHVDVILTMEDHALAGGFGSAVIEALSDARISTPVVRIGWPDQFIEHGKPDDLRIKYGISVKAAMDQLRPYLQAPVPSKVAARES